MRLDKDYGFDYLHCRVASSASCNDETVSFPLLLCLRDGDDDAASTITSQFDSIIGALRSSSSKIAKSIGEENTLLHKDSSYKNRHISFCHRTDYI